MNEEKESINRNGFRKGTVVTAPLQHQQSSSEDLGNQGFDEEHADLEKFVRGVPKIELHCHLDGSFEPQILWDHLQNHPELFQCFPVEKSLPWAKSEDKPLPLRLMVESCKSSLEYRHLCTCRRRYRKLRHEGQSQQSGSLEDMLECFQFFFPLVYDNFVLLEQLAFDFVKRQHEQNVIYTEVRYSPHLLAKDPCKAYEAVTRGLRKGCAKFMIDVNQILCAISFSPDWSTDIVEMANRYRENFPCAVVAIDIAAGEDHFSSDSHLKMCQKAKELGVNMTIHAGETPGSADNVRKAIVDYGATRIGHAYRTTSHPDILEMLKSKGIHVEVCPTSSVETGGWEKTEWIQHPACTFRNHGISISLNSDDPAVFNTSLTVSTQADRSRRNRILIFCAVAI